MADGVIALTLPYPVSANRYWRSFVPRGHSRAIVTLSDEAKTYRDEVQWAARAAGVRAPIEGRVSLVVRLYPHRPMDWAKRAGRDPLGWDDDVRSIDLDNALKVLIDSIKGVVIADDRWIRRIVAERMEPDGKGRAEIEVRAMAVVHPQLEIAA